MPAFESELAGLVPLGAARITLHRVEDGVLVADSIIPIQPGDTAVDLSISVAIITTTQEFELNIYLITPAGDTAFHGGPEIVIPSSNPTEPVTVEVELRYVGVGSDAVTVRILSEGERIFSGDSLLLSAEAYDSAGEPIPGTPIGWASLDPLTASVPDDTLGWVVGEGQRGMARITATLLTNQADTTTVAVQPAPTQLTILSGATQHAEVGQTLPDSVVLQVLGGDGLPIQGVSIELAVQNDGLVSPDSLGVDASGRMAFEWELGTTPGTQSVLATVVEFPAVQTTVTATADAKPAVALTIVSGNDQTGVVVTPLTDSLVVLATDVDGLPVANTTVTWSVTLNDGTVSPATSTTDANGLAATAWTLGSLAGANEVQATIPADTVTFVATGTAGDAAVLELVSGDAQSDTVGATLPLPLVVRVTDLFGNPVQGTPVDFATADGGTLTPVSPTTDVDGLAQSVWTLGLTAGPQTATASSTGLAGSPLTFSTTVTPAPHVNNWTGTAGDGMWTTASNWSRNEVPTVIDTVVIGLPETVTLSTTTGIERLEITDESARLRIAGVSGTATLTVANGAASAGTVELTNASGNASANLSIAAGTLLNTGTIEATLGAGGGTRTIEGTIDNQGTLAATSYSLGVTTTGVITSTTGTLAASARQVVNVSGGTLQFGSGTALSGSGIIRLAAGTTLELPTDFTLAPGDYTLDIAGDFNTDGISVNGPGSFIVADTLTLEKDTVNAPLVVSGIVNVDRSTLATGSVTTTASGRLGIRGTSGTTTLNVDGGLSNAGTVELTNISGNASAALAIGSGTLLNTGTIVSTVGAGSGSRVIYAETVDNQGTISASTFDLTINHATTGTVTSTNGTLEALVSRNLYLDGGTTQFGSGTVLSGPGAVSLSAGTTLELVSDFTLAARNGQLGLAGGTGISVNGPGAFIVADTLELARDTINAPLTVQGLVDVPFDAFVTGPMVSEAGALVRVLGTSGSATLFVENSFTNAGAVEITNVSLNASATLAVNGGTLINTGLIESTVGAGSGGRVLGGPSIDNQGTISATSYALTVNNTNGTFTNADGTLATPNGNILYLEGGLTQFGSGTVLAGTGAFRFGPGTTLDLVSDFTLAAGNYALQLAGTGDGISVNGPGTFIVADTLLLGTDTLNAATVIPGVINVDVNALATGSVTVPVGGTLNVRGTSGTTIFTAGAGVSNAGTVDITTFVDGNASAILALPAAPLVNSGTLRSSFGAGSGGTRSIAGAVDNRGTISIDDPLTITGQLISPAGATGTVTQTGGNALFVQGLDVVGMVFDAAALVSTDGTIARFDSVTFQNMSTGTTQLTINHPGAATPFAFTGLRFLTTPLSGFYIRAEDTDPGDGVSLVINMVESDPLDGSAFESEAGGASINWVSAPPGVSWTGAGDGTSWADPGNWDKNRVPGGADTAYVALDGATISLAAGANVEALEVTGVGASITQTAGTFTIDSSATIAASASYALGGGTLTGAGTIVVAGAMTWGGGAMRGVPGVTRIETGGTLDITSTSLKILTRNVENAGTITWTGTGNVNSNSHDFTNEAGATFIADGTLWDFVSSSGAETVTNVFNLGTITHTAGTTTMEIVLDNTGVVDVQAGSLDVSSSLMSNSLVLADGATLAITTG
ncbi:MAG: hypothetical protein PVH40_02785, partial [Gemmatimonadales bacterium]